MNKFAHFGASGCVCVSERGSERVLARAHVSAIIIVFLCASALPFRFFFVSLSCAGPFDVVWCVVHVDGRHISKSTTRNTMQNIWRENVNRTRAQSSLLSVFIRLRLAFFFMPCLPRSMPRIYSKYFIFHFFTSPSSSSSFVSTKKNKRRNNKSPRTWTTCELRCDEFILFFFRQAFIIHVSVSSWQCEWRCAWSGNNSNNTSIKGQSSTGKLVFKRDLKLLFERIDTNASSHKHESQSVKFTVSTVHATIFIFALYSHSVQFWNSEMSPLGLWKPWIWQTEKRVCLCVWSCEWERNSFPIQICSAFQYSLAPWIAHTKQSTFQLRILRVSENACCAHFSVHSFAAVARGEKTIKQKFLLRFCWVRDLEYWFWSLVSSIPYINALALAFWHLVCVCVFNLNSLQTLRHIWAQLKRTEAIFMTFSEERAKQIDAKMRRETENWVIAQKCILNGLEHAAWIPIAV